MLRPLNDFATRELEMAQELLLSVCQASAEERVTTFLVNWRNRLANLSTLSPVLACRCGARTLPIFSISHLKR
jgi:hypothetical protein